MRVAAAVLLLPALVHAAPSPTLHRVSTFLIAADLAAESQTLKYEGYLNEALAEFASVELHSTEDLFGAPLSVDSEVALTRAEEGCREGKVAFAKAQYAEAEGKLASGIAEYKKAAAGIGNVEALSDCLAMYSATLFQRSDKRKAAEALATLISINPHYELSPQRFAKPFVAAEATAASLPRGMGGNLIVKSTPAGARVIVDGKHVGFTPLTLSTLTLGHHVVKVERPGYTAYGQFIQLYATDAEVSATLKPISKYQAFEGVTDTVADDVLRGKSSPSLGRLGRSLGLDRALVGVLKQVDVKGASELSLGLFDAANNGRQLAFRRMVFQGDEFGELRSELSRMVTSLLVTADGSAARGKAKSDDPLEGKSGLEDWGGDDRGGRNAQKTRKPRHTDPLDTVSGMEDW